MSQELQELKNFIDFQVYVEDVMDEFKDDKMHVELDVTYQCNFSCLNCNRHSNFNAVKDPTDPKKTKGLNLYENTDVSLELVQNFIDEIKQKDNVDRIFILGGEPLVHPKIDQIIDMIREQLYIKHVKAIWIISNLHPKMLKANTLDTPSEIIKFMPKVSIEQITEGKIGLMRMAAYSRYAFIAISQFLEEGTKEDIIQNIDEIAVEAPLQNEGRMGTYKLKHILENTHMFRGIPVINHKPLDKKASDHRCTLVAPIDSGQEFAKTCDIPSKCGINRSYDGYWPCSNGSAIARLFKLYKYKRTELPNSAQEGWDGIDEEGNAIISKDSGMWDLCKYCQVAAKNQMWERDHGRPVSVSYRRAMGMEEGPIPGLEHEKRDNKISSLVVDGHKKKLKRAPIREKNEMPPAIVERNKKRNE